MKRLIALLLLVAAPAFGQAPSKPQGFIWVEDAQGHVVSTLSAYSGSSAATRGSTLISKAASGSVAATQVFHLAGTSFTCASIPSTTPMYKGQGPSTVITFDIKLASLSSFIARCSSMTITGNDGSIILNAAGTEASGGRALTTLTSPRNIYPPISVSATVYTASTAAELQSYINGSSPTSFSSGDVIRLLPATTYTLTADLQPPVGRLAGVIIEGYSDTIIQPTDATHGRWVIDNNAAAGTTIIRTRDYWAGRMHIKLNGCSATTSHSISGCFILADGTFVISDIDIGANGTLTTTMIENIGSNHLTKHINAYWKDCYLHDSGGAGSDIISTEGDGTTDTSSNVILWFSPRVWGSLQPSGIANPGSGATDQNITCHTGVQINAYGVGAILTSNRTQNVGGDGTRLGLFGMDCQGTGTVAATHIRNTKFAHQSGALTILAEFLGNHQTVTSSETSGLNSINTGTTGVNINWNRITGDALTANLNAVQLAASTGSHQFIGNEIDGFSGSGDAALRLNSDNNGATFWIAGNWHRSCYYGTLFLASNPYTIIYQGNRHSSNTEDIALWDNTSKAVIGLAGIITKRNSGNNFYTVGSYAWPAQEGDTTNLTDWQTETTVPRVQPAGNVGPVAIGAHATFIWQTQSAYIAGAGASRTTLGNIVIIRDDGATKAVTPSSRSNDELDWWGMYDIIGANFTRIYLDSSYTDDGGNPFFISGRTYTVVCGDGTTNPIVEAHDLGRVVIGSFKAL